MSASRSTTPSSSTTMSPLKRALLALDEMQARLDAQERAARSPVAVVGLGCRFPGASSPEALWRLLLDGVDTIREVPASRWPVDAYFDPDPEAPGKVSTRWGGFLDDIERFDAGFFGIAPREAEHMDPQQRLVLEVAWEAMEDAGQTAEALAGSRSGVFLGFCFNDYARELLARGEDIDAYTSTGGANSILANRLSYVLDLRGPSLTVDTACSSSLVAVHLACRSLRAGECDLAFAGGVNLMLDPPWTVSFSKFGMMAKDGRCKTFDARADGFVRGEGCGIVVLKRLADARAAGDPVLAVIRGTAINQDGRSNGLTAPNGRAQEAVVRAALADADLGTEVAVGYVEAHGTGTILGDPIEVEALRAVYGAAGRAPCAVGAIKTNLGHLEAAAGVAGLIKTVLALERGVVPPNLHFRSLNPGIELDGSRLVLPTEPLPWNHAGRAAGVSSFGFGGTNAHIVLAAADDPSAVADAEPATRVAESGPWLLPVSARAPGALATLAGRYRDLLRGAGGSDADAPETADVCAAAARQRSALAHRLTVVGADAGELAAGLDAFVAGEPDAAVAAGEARSGSPPGLVFVFSGQGAQWLGMGRRLLAASAAFREALDACDAAVRAETGWSVRAELEADQAGSRLAEVDVVQPTLFALQVALAAHWRSWGIEPDAVVGHSMGEAAAAQVAGALSLEDAAAVICRRSRLLRRLAGQGAMAVVELSFADARAALGDQADRVAVAASNSARSTVLSGEPEALAAVLDRLAADDVFCRRIKVDVASHSPAMDPLRDDLLAALADLRPRPGRIKMLSTVTRKALSGDELDAAYWQRNLRQPVRLHDAIETLLAEDHSLFVEISPHPILLPAIEPGIGRAGGVAFGSLRRDHDDRRALLEALGGLFCHGLPVEWQRIDPRPIARVALPSYPWQRERFWLDRGDEREASSDADRAGGARRLPEGLGAGWVPAFAPDRRCFDVLLQPGADARQAYLLDNRLHDHAVAPGTLFLDLMRAAAARVVGGDPAAHDLALEELLFHEPLVLPARGGRRLQVVVAAGGTVEVFAPASAGAPAAWPCHASARWSVAADGPPELDLRTMPDARHADARAATAFYDRLASRGLACGPAYRGLSALAVGDGAGVGELVLPATCTGGADGDGWHPALLEAAFQLLVAALPGAADGLFLSAGADRLWLAAGGAGRAAAAQRGGMLRGFARVEPDADGWLGDLHVVDGTDTVLLAASRVHLVPLADAARLLAAMARRQLGTGDVERSRSLRAVLAAAAAGPERRGLLEEHVRGALGAVLKLAPARIDLARSLAAYGTDSVMALKLRNRLEESLGLTLSASVIWNHPTLDALVVYLADQLGLALDTDPVAVTVVPLADAAGTLPPELDEPVAAKLDRELALVDALLEDA